MAAVGVHVELTVRLGRGVDGFHSTHAFVLWCGTSRFNPRAGDMGNNSSMGTLPAPHLFFNEVVH